jgi:hypothetical protein
VTLSCRPSDPGQLSLRYVDYCVQHILPSRLSTRRCCFTLNLVAFERASAAGDRQQACPPGLSVGKCRSFLIAANHILFGSDLFLRSSNRPTSSLASSTSQSQRLIKDLPKRSESCLSTAPSCTERYGCTIRRDKMVDDVKNVQVPTQSRSVSRSPLRQHRDEI